MKFLRTVESTQKYSFADQPSAKFYFPEGFDSTIASRIKQGNAFSYRGGRTVVSSVTITNHLSNVKPSFSGQPVSVTTILKKGQDQKSYSSDVTNIRLYVPMDNDYYSGTLNRSLTANTIGGWTFTDLYEDNAPIQEIVTMQSTFRVPFFAASYQEENFYIDFIVPVYMKNDAILKYNGTPQNCIIKKFQTGISISIPFNSSTISFYPTPSQTITYELTYTVPLVGKSLIL